MKNGRNNGNNNKRKNKKSVRGRSEIGKTGATAAIRQWDRLEAAREEYVQKSTEYNNNNQDTIVSMLPSVEEAEANWKIDPTNPNRLVCNKEDNKWKIVLTLEDFYATAVQEKNSRSTWTSFDQFKTYMKDKYYVDDFLLDCLVSKRGEGDDADTKDSKGKDGDDANDNKK